MNTPPEYKEFTEGRRGFTPQDYGTTPKRKHFDTEEAIHEAMAGNQIAYGIWLPEPEGRSRFYLSILARYVILTRAKKSHPWQFTGESVLGSCQADADEKAGDDGYNPLRKVVNDYEWTAMQARQHLRLLGIKAT